MYTFNFRRNLFGHFISQKKTLEYIFSSSYVVKAKKSMNEFGQIILNEFVSNYFHITTLYFQE